MTITNLKKKVNDACSEKTKNEPVICGGYLLYTRATHIKANVVCELQTFGKVLVMFSFFPFPRPDQSNPVLEMDNCNENEPEIC